MSNFADGVTSITLSQNDLSKAVEYWLNNVVLRHPATVVEFVESKTSYSSTFRIGLKEVPPSGAFYSGDGSYIVIVDGKIETWVVPESKVEEVDESS